ncbi:hypothetical protein AeMF1_006331, partial [Aphanomyces euteiches]
MASKPSSPQKEEETESQQQPKRPKTDEQPPHEAAKPQQEEQAEEIEAEELNQGSNQEQESQQEEQAEEMEVEESSNDPNQQTSDRPFTLDGRNTDKGEEMEVDAKSTKRNTSQTGEEDGFEAPRSKKRTVVQQSSPTVKSWASDNFFEVLNQIETNMHILEINQDIPTRVYIPTVQKIPTDVASINSAYLKKQQVVGNKLDWHPDNLTMEEFLNVLQQSVEEGAAFTQHAQVIASTDYSGIELNTVDSIRRCNIDVLWKMIRTQAQSMNFVLTKLATNSHSEYSKIVRMHTWHRWIAATQLPMVESFTNGFKFIFQEHPRWQRLEEISNSPEFFKDAPDHPALSTELVEDTLSAFELWLA